MEIAIVGNGPSYEEYLKQIISQYDVVVGCNYPDIRILDSVSYSVFADSLAARQMRKKGRNHYYLEKFKLVLGARAEFGLTCCKDEPGGQRTCLDYFRELDIIEEVIHAPNEVIQEFETDNDQRYYNSGHMAYQFVCEKWPDAEVSIYGVDSLFGQSKGSLTEITVKGKDTIWREGELFKSTTNKWKYNWNILMDKYSNKTIFYGPELKTLNLRQNNEQ